VTNPYWIAACLFAGGLNCCAVLAQTPPPPDGAGGGLARAVEAAWQRSRAGNTVQARVDRAEARQAAADSLLPAPPALELAHRTDRWNRDSGARENEVGIALPLWLPGQRAARQAAAGAERTAADLAAGTERLRLAGEVREAAWTVGGLQAEARVAEAQLAYLQALAADVARRVKAGDLARTDALAARAEALAAAGARSAVQERLAAGLLRWQALTGLDALDDPAEAPPPRDPAASLTATHPLLQAAAMTVERARRELDVARTDRADAPELSVKFRQEVPERDQPNERTLAFGLRLPLGGANRNRPLLATAQSELTDAQVAEHRLRLQLEAEIGAARAALEAAEHQAASERERAGLLREHATLVDASFRAGETSLPDLLRTAANAAQAEATLARQQAALGLARARLNQNLGLLP